MSLSKSKYCRGVQCKKMLWIDKYHPEYKDESLVNDSVFDNGNEVGDLAMSYFGDFYEIPYNEDYSKMISDTKEKIDEGFSVICEASFNYDGNFCSVDILKKDGDGYSIYEVKSSTELKDIYVDDASYQYYVLNNLGYKINSVNVMYIDSSYVREDELEIDKLFKICDITDIAKSKQNEIKNNILEFKKVLDKNEYDCDIDIYCEKPYPCIYKTYCMKNIPSNSVFDINGMQNKKKYDLYHKGYITFLDIYNSNEKISDKNKDQIEIELGIKDIILDKEKIKEFLSSLTYPLYFLDFETFQQAIPLWKGVSPYMQIPFQYSLHYYENRDKELYHKEFLAKEGINPMRSLAEALVRDIPKDVCVLAYNMSFEKTVIKKLADNFPDLSYHLLNIRDNIKDLMIPFYNHDYYVKEMKGSYSIKYVLPALFPDDCELNYKKLDEIHNGSEAMNAYFNLVNKSKEEIEKTRENLLKYCYLDTYAMVKILNKLEEIINED